MSRPLKLVVLGMMGRVPFAGQTWLYLNWLRGLAALGHEVWYVEDDNVWPYDPDAEHSPTTARYAAAAHRAQHGARRPGRTGGPSGSGRPRGACFGHDAAAARRAVPRLRCAAEHRRRDRPARTSISARQSASTSRRIRSTPSCASPTGDAHMREAFASHHVIVTYGENYGAPDCGVPL